MSNYFRITRNPKTDKFEAALWLDDHFGLHNYGVRFKDGSIYKEEQFKKDDLAGFCGLPEGDKFEEWFK